MRGISSPLLQKFWQTLAHANTDLFTAETFSRLTRTPLLDSAAIADLRQRALHLLETQTGNKSVLQRQHGEYVSPRRGMGLDYEESRVYLPGDDMRFMNWRLTARTNEAHVKVFREERQPGAFILFDRRSSMRFGTHTRLKVTQALRAAIVLAFYQHYSGRVLSGGIMDESLHWLDSADDEQGVLALIAAMNKPCPPQPVPAQNAALLHALRVMQNTLIRGTQVYLVSDFMDLDQTCQAVLAHLAAQHEVSAIHVTDPVELQLPQAGKLRLTSTAAVAPREVDTADPGLASQFQHAAQQHLSRCESLLRGAGVAYARLMSSTDTLESHILLPTS